MNEKTCINYLRLSLDSVIHFCNTPKQIERKIHKVFTFEVQQKSYVVLIDVLMSNMAETT